MKLLAVLGAASLFLSACAADTVPVDTAATTAPSETTTPDDQAELSTASRIGADGIHPLKAGMTLAEVRDAAGRELILEGFEDFEGFCWFARVEGFEENFSLLFLAPERTEKVSDPDEGELGRVSAHGDRESSPARSTGGPGIGATKDEVMQAYNSGPGHSIEVTPHSYSEGGEYIDVASAKLDDGRLLRFETDAKGVVTAIHGGLVDAVQLVEGCA